MPEPQKPIPLAESPKILKESAKQEGESLFAVCAKNDEIFLIPVKRSKSLCVSFDAKDVAEACKSHGMVAVGTFHTHPCSDKLCILPSGEDMFYYAKISEFLPLFCIASQKEFVCYYRGENENFQEVYGKLKELPSLIVAEEK
ncbi:MAG: hypothetical protein DRJ03_10060 [Chloroflexi bacterium]|nr:MAG: hypothetical protein DRJ03_10060 [Chloroflexota bacterium]